MNSLEECGPGVWGRAESLERLGKADAARLLLLSDTHGRADLVCSILKRHGPSCDALVFAGDGLADIIGCYEEAIVAEEMMAALPPIIAVVAGNCDASSCRVLSPKSPAESVIFKPPSMQILSVCGKKMLVAHGHIHYVKFSLESLAGAALANGCQIAVYGHTHIAGAKSFNSVFAINPGSPCLPRGGSEASFAILELKAGDALPAYSFYKADSVLAT